MVVLKPSEYKSIVFYLDECITEYDEFKCLEMLITRFPNLSEDTLGSILHHYVCKKTKMNHNAVTKNKDKIMQMYSEYKKGDGKGLFMELSKQYKLSPVSVARQFLTYCHPKIGKDKSTLWEQIKDTTLIDDPYLSYEVHLASLYDCSYSMISSVIKMCIGNEYETILQKCLDKEGILYNTEEKLRELGYEKTPDILLQMPVAVGNKVIKWIESKALFSDEYSHYEYLQAQYCHYTKAYGAGLVIYWFGHVSSIIHTEGIIVSDKFPDNIVRLKP